MTDGTGTQFGAYELGDVIGDGGMGTVYAAVDRRFGRKVAIKLLHPHLSRNPEVVRRFRTEAVIGAKLSHPHIVRVYDVLESDGVMGFVMEHVEGRSLDRLIEERGGRLSGEEVRTILRQVVSGVAHAHGAGLVHRDLKPSNILVETVDGELIAKVSDFGVAKVVGGETHVTGMGAKIGTLAYMSPEQIRDPSTVDARSDVYSLGILAYELLTGRLPFEEETEFKVMRKILAGDVRPLEGLKGTSGSPLVPIIRRCLSTDPARRFADGRDMLRALDQPGAASLPPPGPPAQPPVPAPGPAAPRPPVESQGTPRTSSRLPPAALGAGVLVVVALGAYLLFRPGDGSERGAEPRGRAHERASPEPAPAQRAPDPSAQVPPAPQAPGAGVVAGAPAPTPEPPPPVASRWQISSAHAFQGGHPTPTFASIVSRLEAPTGDAGTPVEARELRAWMDDPRAGEVYRAELIKYATPKSKEIQKREHVSYISIFMKPKKLEAGVAFLRDHADELASARARHGVAPEDVVSVLMWESNLGKVTGQFRVFNIFLGQILFLDDAFAEAEATAGTMPPGPDRDKHLARLERIKRRAADHLVALLRNSKAKGVDPLSVTGSWGGAIGFPQFMPASFQYAADGNGDGVIDLTSFPDAITSIANYLEQHGYRRSRAGSFKAYNPEDEYVRGVRMYADRIRRMSRG